MKKIALVVLMIGFLSGCGNNKKKSEDNSSSSEQAKSEQSKPVSYDKVDGVAVDMDNKGIGPVKSVTLDDQIDEALAAKGKDLYEKNCLACHKPTKKFIGPAPQGILERRSPEWIMNMIINPTEMTQKDPIAKQLLIEYNGSPMADMGIDKDQARAILEYFRTLKDKS